MICEGIVVTLDQLFSESTVALDVGASDKLSAISRLAAMLAPFTDLDEKDVRLALLAREQLRSTGLSGGIAVPHAIMTGLTRPVALLMRLKTAIDFDSMDGEPSDLICGLLWPLEERGAFLPTLALLCRTLRDERTIKLLRSATSRTAALMAILSGPESAAELSPSGSRGPDTAGGPRRSTGYPSLFPGWRSAYGVSVDTAPPGHSTL